MFTPKLVATKLQLLPKNGEILIKPLEVAIKLQLLPKKGEILIKPLEIAAIKTAMACQHGSLKGNDIPIPQQASRHVLHYCNDIKLCKYYKRIQLRLLHSSAMNSVPLINIEFAPFQS